MTEAGGVLCLYKEAGMTSHDAVNIVRRLYGTRQVGHTGTLDPDATGVLVIMVGRAVKAAEFLGSSQKEYTATLRLGLTTSTEDTSGEVLSRYEGKLPDFEEVKRVCKSFTGSGEQIPPMYSALKINGQKLVNLARKNKEIERQPRQIEIYSLSVEPGERPGDYLLRTKVSAGTYIRTLCADIGKKLGCGGVMASLERTACGERFTIDKSVRFSLLEELDIQKREELLLPTEELFADLPIMRLPASSE